MNTEESKQQESNIFAKFVERYHSKPPHIELKDIAKALELSTHQLYRLRTGECKIMNYRKRELNDLDHFLRHDGKIEDFKLS